MLENCIVFLTFLDKSYLLIVTDVTTVICVLYTAEKFRSDLCNIAMTTLSSKILSQDKEHFANLAVDAVLRLKVHLLDYLYPGCNVVL